MAKINFAYTSTCHGEFKQEQVKITSLVVSIEEGKTTQVDIPVKLLLVLENSVKVAGMSEQIDLTRNTDCRVRPNL